MTVSFNWRTGQTVLSNNADEDLLNPVSGDFSVVATLLVRPTSGAAGIKLHNDDGDFWFTVGDALFPGINVVSVLPVSLLVQWSSTDNKADCYYSVEAGVWNVVEPNDYTIDQPTTAGVFMTTDGTPQTATFAHIRTVAGEWLPETIYAPMAFSIGEPPEELPIALTPCQENVIHALVGTQFGDLEFDVGKSVRWTQWFTDDVFVTDLNTGSQRFWVINWAASFPEVNYKVTGVNFFYDPVVFRKQQWADAITFASQNPASLYFDDEDWVIFVDGHEGISADNRSLPDDYLVEPFRSYLYREVARANDNDADRIVLPFFVYLNHKHVQNVQYHSPRMNMDGTPGQPIIVEQSVGAPYYLPHMGLTRMFRVSTVRDPNFDWTILDTPVAIPDPTVKLQIVSYGYAHWNLQDIEPPQTEIPPLTAQNDDGWRQRCLLSTIRPIPGLPTGDPADPVGTWQPPSADPTGLRGPWAFDTYESRNLEGVVIPNPPPAIAAATEGVRVPLYDLVYRFNMRDGVWYEEGATGAIPLVWNPETSKWEPVLPAKEWVKV